MKNLNPRSNAEKMSFLSWFENQWSLLEGYKRPTVCSREVHYVLITPSYSVEAANWKLLGDLVGLLGLPQPPALAILTLAQLPTKEEVAFSNVSMYALKK